MYDLVHSYSTLTVQKPVTSGYTVDREGVLLQSVLSGGIETVQKGAASASLVLAGFAISDNQTISIAPAVETGTIPLASPYTIQLSNNNLVGTSPNVQIYIVSTPTSGSPTFSQQTNSASSTGQFWVAPSTGLITFYSGDAGTAVQITYRYNLTVAQAQQRYFQRNINNTAGAVFNTVAVLTGAGEVWTSEYDATVNWAGVAAGAVLSG